MIYVVQLRYIGGDLVELMRDMRIWLDHVQIEAEEFLLSSGPLGLTFRVGFADRDDASAFAQAFGGYFRSADHDATRSVEAAITVFPSLNAEIG